VDATICRLWGHMPAWAWRRRRRGDHAGRPRKCHQIVGKIWPVNKVQPTAPALVAAKVRGIRQVRALGSSRGLDGAVPFARNAGPPSETDKQGHGGKHGQRQQIDRTGHGIAAGNVSGDAEALH
jgi:hypothetical protein